MTIEEHLTGVRVPGEPNLWPAWSYLGLAIMTVGVLVALMVLAITSTHRTEDRETALRVESIQVELDALRASLRAVERQAEANAERIEGGK
jgi:hypothetical protein